MEPTKLKVNPTLGKWKTIFYPAETQIWTSLPSDDNKADVQIPICIMANEAPISVNEAIANANRIVKCVNMHDVLISMLKRELVSLEEWNGNGNYTFRIEEIKDLLKQAEQE